MCVIIFFSPRTASKKKKTGRINSLFNILIDVDRMEEEREDSILLML